MPHNTDLTGHRKESTTRQKGTKPLWTFEPLSANRERPLQVQAPQKRRRPTPPTPFLSYNPQDRLIPNGRRDPSASLHTSSEPDTLETSTNLSAQQPTSFGNREMHAQFHDGVDAQWLHISDHPMGHSIPSYPDTSYTENDMNSVLPDAYDSPASYTSSSSPAASDQSPRTAEFANTAIDYAPPAQPSMSMCPYEGQGYVAVHQGPYVFSMDPYSDHHIQSYPVQYVEPARGRPGLHGDPPCPGNNGYQYPYPRRS